MVASLVLPEDLADFPGAPFAESLVTVVGATVRREVGWHISPAVTETVVVESAGGRYLLLPTLNLTAVTEVRDVTDEDVAPVVLTGYRTHETARFRAGVLDRPAGWPTDGVVEVDIVHGFDQCPPDLLSAVAEWVQAVSKRTGGLGSRTLGDLSESYRSSLTAESRAAVEAYKIPRSR